MVMQNGRNSIGTARRLAQQHGLTEVRFVIFQPEHHHRAWKELPARTVPARTYVWTDPELHSWIHDNTSKCAAGDLEARWAATRWAESSVLVVIGDQPDGRKNLVLLPADFPCTCGLCAECDPEPSQA